MGKQEGYCRKSDSFQGKYSSDSRVKEYRTEILGPAPKQLISGADKSTVNTPDTAHACTNEARHTNRHFRGSELRRSAGPSIQIFSKRTSVPKAIVLTSSTRASYM